MTDSEIRILRAEADGVGDTDMAAICDLALEGDEDARTVCLLVRRCGADYVNR